MSDNSPYTEHGNSRFSHLENKVEHLDTTVGQLMQNQASMDAKLGTVLTGLDKITTRINEPHDTNWWGMISSLVALVLLMAGGVLMKTAPMEAAILEVHDAAAANTEVLHERSYTLGRHNAQLEYIAAKQVLTAEQNEAQWGAIGDLRVAISVNETNVDNSTWQHRHLDEQVHAHDRRISSTEKKAAAGEVSRAAIGEYAKEVQGRVTKHAEVFQHDKERIK